MTHFYMRRDVYKSGGRSAADRVAYITRQPVQSLGERQVQYISQGREDCLFTTSRNLPAWCEGKAHVYFAAAERYEGAGWVAFEELKIGLPVELSHGQNMGLMRDLVEAIAGDRLPITYAFHAPRTMDETQEQPHLHLILSRRQTDAHDRGPARHFRRYNATHPARGGAQKDKAFAERLAQRHLRVLVSDVVNLHLERAGCTERVHPGSLKSRGINREPEPKLLPSESQAYRKEGKVSPRMQEVLAIRTERQRTRAHEQQDARAYWAQRKVTLGLSEAMDAPTQLATIGEARAQGRDHAPARQVAESAAAVEQDDRLLGDRGGEAVRHMVEEAQSVWDDACAEHTLQGIGLGVIHTVMDDAHDAWRDTQEVQALRDVGWEAVRTAQGEGQALLAGAPALPQTSEQGQAGQSLEQAFLDLAEQLDRLSEDEGSAGRMRVRLWDQDQGRGL